MAEQKTSGNAFKEAVCIDAGRIYDSCSEIDYSRFTHFNTKEKPEIPPAFLYFTISILFLFLVFG